MFHGCAVGLVGNPTDATTFPGEWPATAP
jgi:hypothetical protein